GRISAKQRRHHRLGNSGRFRAALSTSLSWGLSAPGACASPEDISGKMNGRKKAWSFDNTVLLLSQDTGRDADGPAR
ncbi:hypothetical protein, partial [Pseudophaeobacter sp.]|uniref:hypothetical protein n=1 Tax=Pseudophaeobacter sp. TaxID=1971739 RepID=UPI003298568E